MIANLKKIISKNLIMIPGIKGIVPIDFSKPSKMLKEEKYSDGISIEETNNGVIILIAIFISNSINTKFLSQEIKDLISNILKKDNIKINNIKVYIRGVK